MGSDAIRWHVHCSVCGAFIEKSAHCDSEVECKKCRSTLEILVKDDIVSVRLIVSSRQNQDQDPALIPSQSWLIIRLLQRYVITVPMRQVQKVILRTSTVIFQQERDLFLSIWRLLMLMAVVMRSMELMQQDRN